MTEQDKITVDDIIGIVKTEEQTNSVEEVRKLRGRENETTKRFTIQGIGISDHKKKRLYDLQTIDGFISVRDELNALHEENEQLRTKNNAYIQDIEVFKEENTHLKLENEQLKERNQRQAKRLAELYELMAKKDWEALTEIIDEFCSFEEQLQKEWKCYE